MRPVGDSRFIGAVMMALLLATTVTSPVGATGGPGGPGPGDDTIGTGRPSILGGVTIVSARSSIDMTSPKSVSVSCPSDTKPIGAGAEIGYTSDRVHITGIVPYAYTNGGGVRAYASGDDSFYYGNWTLKVIAVCAIPPAGYEIVDNVPVATDGPDELTGASCPDGKELLGGGAWIRTPPANGYQTLPDVILRALIPSDSHFTVAATEDADGTTTRWTLDTYAICSLPILGRQEVVAGGLVTALGLDHRSQTVSCPVGTRVLSAGGFINPGASEDGRIAFTRVAPISYGGSHYVTVEAALTQDEPEASTWGLLAHAICAPVATPVPG